MIDRFCRVMVPYVPVLVLIAIVNALFPLSPVLIFGNVPGVRTGPVAFIGNLLLLNDYPILQIAAHVTNIDAIYVHSYRTAEQFWTIPLEFGAYIVCGYFIYSIIRGEKIPLYLAVPTMGYALPIFVWNAIAGINRSMSLTWALGSVFAYFWVAHLAKAPYRFRVGRVLLAFGALGFAARIVRVGYAGYGDFQQHLFIALVMFGLLCVIPDGMGWGSISKVTRWFAGYTYSLYLVHNTIVLLVHDYFARSLGRSAPFVAYVAAHPVALLCYFAFEKQYPSVARWMKGRRSTAENRLPRVVPAGVGPVGGPQ
jgi:peptidoglycan/LPS O-acetylase OafA/YrhL